MTGVAALEMQGMRRRFGGVQALDGASLMVPAGQVHALLGQNGAGKSTLMRILVGAETADAGEMRIAGRPHAPDSVPQAQARGVAMVHQELALAPHLTVAQNIALGREPARLGVVLARTMRAHARAALAAVGAGAIDPETPAHALRPGARQLVEIARAVASGPRILVLDEPTSSLGAADAAPVFDAIARLRDAGVAIVLISHHLGEVRRAATHATVLRDGRTAWSGTLVEVSDAALVESMAGAAVAAVCAPGAAPAATPAPTAIPAPSATPLLEVSALRSQRMRAPATLHAFPGEVLGIAGLVGAGRTALLRAIAGLDAPVAGGVRVGGASVALARGPARALAAGIALVSEDRRHEGLALRLPWGVNLALPQLARLSNAGILRPSRIESLAERARAALVIRAGSPWQPAAQLSGGNQQKVALARALELDARVLLLDEPTRGVDVAAKAQIQALVRAAAAQGRAVVLVSSELDELLALSDRVAVLRDGQLGAARPAAQVDPASILAASFRAQEAA
ncbi:MAG: sugar ABC transporter ATP-binding protein [Phycisphaerales bacterium]